MRRELMRHRWRTGDPARAMRFLAVARLGLGHSSVRVANGLDVARSTVVRTATRFATDGRIGLFGPRRHNEEAKVDERFRRRVVQMLRRTPQDFGWMRPTWTRELLGLQMHHDRYVAVAACTIGRVLAKIGARLGMAKAVVLSPWPRYERSRVLAQVRRLEGRADAAEPVLYGDEVDIHLNPKIGRDWMLRGQQRRVVTPGKNKKFYLAGAPNVRSGRLHTTGADRKNASLFCYFLRLIASKYRAVRRVHVVLDNYGVHRAKLTKRTLAVLGDRIRLHFLTPYCPDANRIERVWQELHANITRNHRCKILQQLLTNFRHFVVSPARRHVLDVGPVTAETRERGSWLSPAQAVLPWAAP